MVAELLRTNPDIELIDAREFVPNFKARPGLSTWHVLDDTFVEAKQRQNRRAQKQTETAATEDAGDANKESEPDGAASMEEGDEVDTTAKSQSETTPDQDGGEEEGAAESSYGLQACLDMGVQLYKSFEEVPEAHRRRIRQCVFPPSEEEKEWMHLGVFVNVISGHMVCVSMAFYYG